MKSKVSVLVVIFLLILSIDLPSKERRGAELVVQKNDGFVLKGELIAVKQNSALLLSPEGADVSADIKDIYNILIVKKSQVLKGAGIGLLAGARTGVLIGLAVPVEPAGFFTLSRGDQVLMGAIGLGAVGLLMGTLFGVSASYDEKIMEKLRRQARVRNAQ